MVLAPCGWSHGRHFCERSNHGHDKKPDDDHHLDDASHASVGESEVGRQKGAFPCRLEYDDEADEGRQAKVSLIFGQ